MLYKLQCTVNNYAWGTKGDGGMAANIALAGNHVDSIDKEKTYSEFWVGTHPNGPSIVADSKKSLEDLIKENKTLVGVHEPKKLGFLFKVLSVAGPLSIQIHPTKEQALILHTRDPKNYPDDNHKPEIAIALTDFELLSGFRQHSQINEYLKLYSEIQDLLDEAERSQIDKLGSYGDSSATALKNIFAKIWRSPVEKIQAVVAKLANRLQAQENKSPLDEIIVYLFSLYPGDVGVLAPIFLNYFKLKPGEATFLEPNMPHAYLKGDCVECMACSDNTIRAGLTPKYIDVESLVEMLKYNETLLPKYIPNKLSDGTLLYTPNGIDEFWVQEINGSGQITKLPYCDSSSVLTVLSGDATIIMGEEKMPVSRGNVTFISACHDDVKPTIEVSNDFLAYRAFTPSPKALEDLSNHSLKIE